MIGLLLAGSMVFNMFVVVTGIPSAISSLVTDFSSSPIVFLLITLIVLAVLGTFIDALPLILLVIPILFPIAKSLGIDPVHYGVVAVVANMLGTLTPPVGILIYAVSGVDKEVPMFSIFRGAVPYMILLFLFTMILIAWPSLSLTLVNLMF
jgi:TRAP-type C4-dicarboxylate transport system permease large subunit